MTTSVFSYKDFFDFARTPPFSAENCQKKLRVDDDHEEDDDHDEDNYHENHLIRNCEVVKGEVGRWHVDNDHDDDHNNDHEDDHEDSHEDNDESPH